LGITAMSKLLQAALLVPAILISLLSRSSTPVYSQEYQGCFLIDYDGVLVDLGEICPSSTQVISSENSSELGTGDIQVTLRWTTTDDLDLAVTDPSGNTVTYFNRSIDSGGQLDVDANANCIEQNSSPIENIFWPPSQAPQGQYTIAVNLFQRCAGSGPISFNLTLLVQGNTETLTGTVDEQNPVATFPFSLPR
jgi:hypothetical protein